MFHWGDSGDNESFNIAKGGNVGIGLRNPSNKCEV